MISVLEMMRHGYKALAADMLEVYARVKPTLKPISSEPHAALFERSLAKIRESGDISTVLDENVKQAINHIGSVCERAIPDHSKPTSPQEIITYAFQAVAEYKGFSSSEALQQAAQITAIGEPSPQANVMLGTTPGRPKAKILKPMYKPHGRAESLNATIHETFHTLQDTYARAFAIALELADIQGMVAFTDFVKADQSLSKRLFYATQITHQLRFYAQPDIQKLAGQHGVNEAELKRYLAAHGPTMDFIASFDEGEAYVLTPLAVSSFSRFALSPGISDLYRLEALAVAFIAPASDRGLANMCGIGMYQYLKEKNSIKAAHKSRRLHEEIYGHFTAPLARRLAPI